jgi:hypothetical protein
VKGFDAPIQEEKKKERQEANGGGERGFTTLHFMGLILHV